MKILLSIMTVLCLATSAFAQVDTAQVEADVRTAVNFMDRNLPDKAITYWEKVIEQMPHVVQYKYERAICFLMLEKYQEAIVALDTIYRDSALMDRGWQLMGNCYDFLGDTAKSLPIYREGLQHYPNSGRLHYELGNIAYVHRDIESALSYWLKGTKVEPDFATNYYWIAKAMAATPSRIWSVFYGELFLNLEPGSARTKEISELLYRVWNAGMSLGADDPINYCDDEMLAEHGPKGPTSMNFGTAFEFTIATSAAQYIPEEGVLDHLTINQLVDVRYAFFKGWQAAGYLEMYPNALFDWYAEIDRAGYLKDYFWWTMAYGDQGAMNEYYKQNTHQFDNFMAWIGTIKELPFTRPLCVTIGCSVN